MTLALHAFTLGALLLSQAQGMAPTRRPNPIQVVPAPGAMPLPQQWDFESDPEGVAPAGLVPVIGAWTVAPDPMAASGARVLTARGIGQPKAVRSILSAQPTPREFEMSVALRVEGGRHDRGGGLTWGVRDPKNYFLLRYNPIGATLRLYKVTAGDMKLLQSRDIDAAPGWHVLDVVVRGGNADCSLDSRLYMQAMDAGFANPGRIGLWTQGDAMTLFDDLHVTAVGSPASASEAPTRDR